MLSGPPILLVFSDALEVSKLLYSVTLKYGNFETCEFLFFMMQLGDFQDSKQLRKISWRDGKICQFCSTSLSLYSL